jgi:hypothetical protein
MDKCWKAQKITTSSIIRISALNQLRVEKKMINNTRFVIPKAAMSDPKKLVAQGIEIIESWDGILSEVKKPHKDFVLTRHNLYGDDDNYGILVLGKKKFERDILPKSRSQKKSSSKKKKD